MSGIPWSEQEVDALTRLAAAGVEIRTIAQVLLSRSPKSIQQKLYELNLTITRPEPEINITLLTTLTRG